MNNFIIVGWKEWAKLPAFEVPLIKVKIDTGAKTSALHVYNLEIIKNQNKDFARFIIHPIQKNVTILRYCVAEIIDTRTVKSSNGIKEQRPVIRTVIQLGNNNWEIEISLTKRDIMRHRMLLGREAMQAIFVLPTRVYCQGKITKKKVLQNYGTVNKIRFVLEVD